MKIPKTLSAKAVDAIKEDGIFCVGGAPGLYIQIRGISRVWVFRFTVPGTSRRTMYSIGTRGKFSLEEARNEARELQKLVRDGKNPIVVREAKKEEQKKEDLNNLTFREVAEEWLAKRVKSGYFDENESGEHDVRAKLKNHYYPVFKNKIIYLISQEDLLPVFEKLWKGNANTLRKVAAVGRGVFNYALAHGIVSSNPLGHDAPIWTLLSETSKKGNATQNHGALLPEEMPKFIQEVLDLNTVAAKGLVFSILTVVRSKNIQGLRWRDIDFENARWVIPGEQMKVKGMGAHVVYLSDKAIEILKNIPEGEPDDLVFRNPKTGSIYSDRLSRYPMKQINLRRAFAGLPKWIDKAQSEKLGREILASQHGIARATFKTWSKSFDNWRRFNSDAVELCLAHKLDKRYEGAYDRAAMEKERREVMQAWADFIFNKEDL